MENPHLNQLRVAASLLLVVGVIAFIVTLANVTSTDAVAVAIASTVATLTIPPGIIAALLWATASAVLWKPSGPPSETE